MFTAQPRRWRAVYVCTLMVAVLSSVSMALEERGPLKGRFLVVTDFHYDPTYKTGASVQNFCQEGTGEVQKRDGDSAGLFGTVGSKCDTPESLVKLTFDFIKSQADNIDFILYTGDSALHNRNEDQPRTDSLFDSSQKAIIQYFTKTVDVTKTKVIPVVGNNDVAPHNLCEGDDPQFADIKSLWAPLGVNTTNDFNHGGYYVHDIIPGKLRALNVNSLLFFRKNKKVEDCDVADGPGASHIEWMERVLADARQQGVKVYVLSHVPPNGKKDKPYYLPTCYTAYYNLLGEYSDIIVGHFSGHHNRDMLTAVVKTGENSYDHIAALPNQAPVFSSSVEETVLGCPLFNTPSVYPRNNPGVRVVEYDTAGTEYAFGTVRDWYQYYVNLSGTNNGADGKAAYELEYQASKLYGVDHFDATGLKQAFVNLADDKVLAQYSTYVVVSTPPGTGKDTPNEDEDHEFNL